MKITLKSRLGSIKVYFVKDSFINWFISKLFYIAVV